MKRTTVTRSTGTPRLRAACSFCPRACTQLPNRVRVRQERAERADGRGTRASTCGSRRAAARPSIALKPVRDVDRHREAAGQRDQHAAPDQHRPERHHEGVDPEPDHDQPVDRARARRPRRRRRGGDERRHAEVAHQHHRDVGGEPEHGADREVEVAADHQERHADAEDAELGGHRHDADVGQLGREEVRAEGGEDGEEDDDRGQRRRLGAQHEPPHGLAEGGAARGRRGRRRRRRDLLPCRAPP